MRENRSVSPRSPFSIFIRIAIVSCSLIASIALAVGLLVHAHSAAYADPPLIQTTVPAINSLFGADPWDVKINNGHVWVAEPQCDVNVAGGYPICSHPTNIVVGGILEYSVSGFSNGASPVNKLAMPPGYTSPFFLAFDGSGNLWFSEPVINSIGEYDTGGNWHQWTVPTAKASPLDLTFDQFGHLWFTELTANKIGEFDPASQTFNEYPTPTANSQPYGITGPDPTTHSLWFTENSGAVHRIGRIMPNPDGSINGQINEYLTNISCSSSNCITPHLITYDQNGNIWWSEGYDGAIGELVISQAQNNTSSGVTEHTVPTACPAACSSHISGIAVDGNGTVWFDDALTSRYGSFNPSTSQFTMFIVGGTVTSNAHPHDGLTVDCNNNVWFNQEFANILTEAQSGTGNNACGSPPPSPTTSPSPSPTVTPPPPPLQAGPVNKQWYFAEGRVGAGFTEYLSLDNPTGAPCAVNVTYLYTPDHGIALTKTLPVSIPASTRTEQSVDRDLGTSPNGPGITDSAIVTVDNNATPACSGIVAERPMYFNTQGNNLGANSTSDVLGVTHLGTTFYLADVATGPQNGGKYSSFITILNPPNAPTATVTAAYYSPAGASLGTDQVNVPGGTRGTISPDRHLPVLPPHASVVVTSSSPVAVERPTYFSNVSEGQAGTVSGGADVIGVQSLSNDWLFAEGYTGGQFQENFVIANLDPAHGTASVKIQLELATGPSNPITVQVPPMSQLIWNVNAVAPNQNISAEITSSGAQIVVEREMFFRYNHNNRADGRNLQAMGGTDVLGQVGPGTQTLYSFAEGYVNVGYDEWLTLQNPTQGTEVIWITLDNAMGHTYSFPVTVLKQSRYTVDIVAVVLANLYHNGDGFRGLEVSMTVQTINQGGPFVAERPMYSNVSGIQGGTDIIGYTGG
ncbi:MAG TPA: hypothetical protein VJO32_02970 [Ktedonobacteraceae bacterium]|nr:hypothetical protein [Ktedonobacteraceae bacterium]